MGAFSGVIKLGDISDFISPSQACVVTLQGSQLPETDLRIQADRPQRVSNFAQTKTSQDGAVKVSLHDCLACSGCVTSAESILLEHQSLDELRAKLRQPGLTVVASLSPQSRVSLAKALGLGPLELQERLTYFLKSLGVAYVFDTCSSRDLALLEQAAEFIERKRSHASASSSGGSLPMLASACPGWVCYAEKTHGSFILPYISTTKSPQAVTGSIVKRWLGPQLGLPPERIYHFAIMPCYDKKLEASRDDFDVPGSDGKPVPETDSVLTSSEICDLLAEHGTRLQDTPAAPLDAFPGAPASDVTRSWPGGSGGYLEYVFRRAARELHGVEMPPGRLQMRTLRNADMQETSLSVGGRVVLKFAQAYGFRNIQTLVQKLKRGVCEYDYVEVMACPSGCLNGGGQVKPSAEETPRELVARLDSLYHGPHIQPQPPEDNPVVQALLRDWLGGAVGSPQARQALHTQYHRREASTTAKLSDW